MHPANDLQIFNGKITPPDNLLNIISPQKVFVGTINGYSVVISAWRPSKEDIEAINAGREIYLQMFVAHNCVPPTALFTKDENDKINV